MQPIWTLIMAMFTWPPYRLKAQRLQLLPNRSYLHVSLRKRLYIKAKADEHLTSLTYTGMNVNSDIVAGRPQHKSSIWSDEKGCQHWHEKAQSTRPVSDSIKNEALKRFGWQWINQEIPERPVGITPAFNNLKMVGWKCSICSTGATSCTWLREFNVAVKELEDIRKI